MPDLPNETTTPEERWSLLLTMERLSGRIEQALSQITGHSDQIADHETRLRSVEQESASARGRGTLLGTIGGAVVAVIVSIVATQLGG